MMNPINFSHIKALTFDCYGTLIDWEKGILSVLRPWSKSHGLSVTDDKLLSAFSQFEHLCERADPLATYPDILRTVHARIATHLGVRRSADEANDLAESIRDWLPFVDTVEALKSLQQRYKLLILSNIDRDSFAFSNQKLGVTFDAIITAEDVGSYKPADGHFRRALQILGQSNIGRDEMVHVAQSLFHDHVPAKALGMATVWVDRRRGRSGSGATPPPEVEVEPDLIVHSLEQFVQLVETPQK